MTEIPVALLGKLAEQAERLDGLDATVADLGEDLSALAATLAKGGPAGGEAEQAWWWPHLDALDATNAWAKLGSWVRDALLARHVQYQELLRPCWRRHPDVVDELTALRLLWADAYTNAAAKPGAATEYLTRLPVAMTRVDAAFKHTGCKAERDPVHKDPTSTYVLFEQWDGDEVAAFITADAAARRQGAVTGWRSQLPSTAAGCRSGGAPTSGRAPPRPRRTGRGGPSGSLA